ncbi:MAG: hypothetical protein COV36_03815 [Alphaproteobacteria bacterium CG11_big_fil_rev_8_21_14_0_20_44_7]|nr:MAG: hypothetical protein COV36_03815 [Alphaproteobacteria bacterium CG11_big_fil_rev_8_21_14_0_20_44_7]
MKPIYLLSAMFLISSCASIIQGDTQEIAVNLLGAESAECSVTDLDGTRKFTAPDTITIRRSYNTASVFCSTSDGESGDVKLLSDVSNWGYGGAVLGLGVGAGVDTATGAAFEYPDKITVKIGESITLGETSTNSNVER